ncbi:Methyltransferase domain-containing protein [Tistlia consotensis]|uniref:Methyltransferase domain-containing protein n=1 Tax=Tistlia consotensis USBA 355 TaxID=560819 RepID=A0A1Y6CRM9_9PROT|nr:class I SAM-dependent methyltransferase [Tistlia consotensis]SMF72508.1 Methyltransferase domain-containing protein [Tistlia consotensis USBA 355]SNS09253.1 Methyltransferase domain-containing protein [Tistlia consotensis]
MPQPAAAQRDPLSEERAFLARVSEDYPEIESETEHALRRAAVRLTRTLLPPAAEVVELGTADGYMARLLAPHVARHEIVDAVAFPVARLPASARFHLCLFEEFEPERPADLVIMSLVLEHVLDPVALLARARGWLKPETGKILAIVPNMRALSRQLARAMGLIAELDVLTENDRAHGHRRCYDRFRLDREIAEAGGEVLLRGGLLLKPFANFQMDQMIAAGILGEAQMDGLDALAAEYPDLATAIYAVCR